MDAIRDSNGHEFGAKLPGDSDDRGAERLLPSIEFSKLDMGFILGSSLLRHHSHLVICLHVLTTLLIILFLTYLFLSPVQWIFVGDHFPRNCWQLLSNCLLLPISFSLKLDLSFLYLKVVINYFFRVKSRLSNWNSYLIF